MFGFCTRIKEGEVAGQDNLLTQRFHGSIFSHSLIMQVFQKQKLYERNFETVVVCYVFLSALLLPPLSPSPSPLPSSTHPTPKYGAITNSFTKAPELLVIVSRVFKCSTRWWKHVIWNTEETSGAFQTFMDKKSRLVVFSFLQDASELNQRDKRI